jgi:hypothetical protein
MLQELQADARMTANSVCAVNHGAWTSLCGKCEAPQKELYFCTAVVLLLAHSLDKPEIAELQLATVSAHGKKPVVRCMPELSTWCTTVKLLSAPKAAAATASVAAAAGAIAQAAEAVPSSTYMNQQPSDS